jgi:transcriptional regulator
MYNPPHFQEERSEVLQQLIREHALAVVVTMGPEGLIANHIPLILDAEVGPLGTLRGHVSRMNPQWRDSLPHVAALAIFQGPSAYITPSWYPSVEETGKVVPTYNYVVVHAQGQMRTYEDPALLLRNVRALTKQHEAGLAKRWSVEDAPKDFIREQLKGIVGIEIPIARLEGKWKVSQNRVPADRQGVIDGLQAAGDVKSLTMADEVASRNRS